MISWNFKKRYQQPIGLDIGHNSIKMIQLAFTGGGTKVIAADKIAIDTELNEDNEEKRKFVISAIRKSLDEGNFHGKKVISCMPSDKLKITSIRLPEMENDQIEDTLKKEVNDRFGLDADKDMINYIVAGNIQQGNETKNELILFAADNETVSNHIALLEEAKLRPVAIDTIPCALFRSFERLLRRQEDKNITAVFVDIGNKYTTVVFDREGEISFIKQIPIGGYRFNSEIAAKLDISIKEAELLRKRLQDDQKRTAVKESDIDESIKQVVVDSVEIVSEELAKEISLCLRYYTVTFRGKRVEQAIFAGGEAYENVLLNVLRRQLAVNVQVAKPLRGFDISDVEFGSDKRGLLCEWAVAVGLSLKGWNEDFSQDKSYERN